MSNSTTSWQEAVRARIYQKYMAENPNSFDIPTQEDNYQLDNDLKNFKIINDNDRPQRIDSKPKRNVLNLEKPISIRLETIDQELTEPIKNPDGQDHLIRGQYAEVLKSDSDLLQARAWGVYPGVLTAAIKRMDLKWVQKQVQYVRREIKSNHGAYLARILKKNQF